MFLWPKVNVLAQIIFAKCAAKSLMVWKVMNPSSLRCQKWARRLDQVSEGKCLWLRHRTEVRRPRRRRIKRRRWGEMEGYKLRGCLEAERHPDKSEEKEKMNSSWLPSSLPWDVLNGHKPSQSAVPLRLLSLARLTGVGAGLQTKRVHLITRHALERGTLSAAAQEESASLQIAEHHCTAPPLTSHASSTHLPRLPSTFLTLCHRPSSHCSRCYHE